MLAERNTRMIYGIQLLDAVGFVEPVLALFFIKAGLTPAQILLLWPVMALTNLLAEVPTGLFVDRYGARTGFMTGAAIRVASFLLLLVFPTTWAIFVSRALFALGWTFFSGAQEAVVYESLKADGREGEMITFMGRIGSARYLPMVVTFLIGPLLAQDLTIAQFRLLIGLDALFSLIRFALATRVINPPGLHVEASHPLAQVGQSLRVIRRSPYLFTLVAHGILVFIASNVFFTYDQVFLTGAGLPVAWLGVVYAGGALLGWYLSTQAGRLAGRANPLRLVRLLGLIVLAALAAAGAAGDSLIIGLTAWLGLKAAGAVRSPVISGIQNELIPSEGRATTLSVLSAVDSAFDLLVVPLMAGLATFGLPTLFLGGAAVVGVALLLPLRESAPAKG